MLVWARSATKHRISRERSRFAIEQAQARFFLGDPTGRYRKLLYVGDDQDGTPLEVIAVELDDGELLVIHAMELRRKFTGLYWEAKHGV